MVNGSRRTWLICPIKEQVACRETNNLFLYAHAPAVKLDARDPYATVHVSGLIGFLRNALSLRFVLAKGDKVQLNSAIDPDTLRAYEETHYRVLGNNTPATLRIGVPNPALAELHRAYGVDCSAFVTAV